MCEEGRIQLAGDHQPAAEQRDSPLVTLILLAYNQEKYIHEAIQGACAQTYEPLEIIISDDCSSDLTYEIAQKLVAGYGGPHEVTCIQNEKNVGLAEHFNRVFSLARGHLVICAAGDDVSLPHRAQQLAEAWFAAGKPSCSINSDFFAFSEDGYCELRCQRPGDDAPDIRLAFERRFNYLGATAAYTKDIMTFFGPLPRNVICEDSIMNFRAHLVGRMLYIKSPLVRYRIHTASISADDKIRDNTRWQSWARGEFSLVLAQAQDFASARPEIFYRADVQRAFFRRLRSARRRLRLLKGKPRERVLALWEDAKINGVRIALIHSSAVFGFEHAIPWRLLRLANSIIKKPKHAHATPTDEAVA